MTIMTPHIISLYTYEVHEFMNVRDFHISRQSNHNSVLTVRTYCISINKKENKTKLQNNIKFEGNETRQKNRLKKYTYTSIKLQKHVRDLNSLTSVKVQGQVHHNLPHLFFTWSTVSKLSDTYQLTKHRHQRTFRPPPHRLNFKPYFCFAVQPTHHLHDCFNQPPTVSVHRQRCVRTFLPL